MRTLTLLLLAFALPAAEPDFTVMVLPDTQYLIFTCSPQVFNVMANWMVTNKNADLGTTDQGVNLTLNTKAVLGLGDIVQQGGSEFVTATGNATSGYGIFDANSLPLLAPPGNHDWPDPSTVHVPFAVGFVPPGTVNFANCATTGFFSAPCRAAHGYFGSGVTYGAALDDANYYYRMVTGVNRFLIFSVEHMPRASVLTWAKGVMDANYGWTGIVVTHSFQTQGVGKLGTYTNETGNTGSTNDNGGAGLKTSQVVSDDEFNSGYGMWNGYGGATFTALKDWPQLSMVLNGHWIATEAHYLDTPNTYLYQTNSLSSTSTRSQTVQAIFTDWQDLDGGFAGGGSNEYPTWVAAGTAPAAVSNYCSGNNWAPFRLAHVMILQFRPSIGKVEGYIVATTSGKWEPMFGGTGVGAPAAAPVRLFSLTYATAKRPIFPMGAAVGPQ